MTKIVNTQTGLRRSGSYDLSIDVEPVNRKHRRARGKVLKVIKRTKVRESVKFK